MKKTAMKINLTDSEVKKLSGVCGASPEVVANCRVKNFLRGVVTHRAQQKKKVS